MDKYKEKKNRKKLYRKRRLTALIVFILFLGLLVLILKYFTSEDKKSGEITLDSHKLALLDESLRKPTSLELNKLEKQVDSQEALPMDLVKYRQTKIRDHAMGRGAKQSHLQKQVYLTFDDGPSSESTVKILDILEEEGVKATFFVVGENAKKYPDVLKRTYDSTLR